MILLVEDEKRAREVFVKILKNAGYGVMEAADGLQALSLLEKRHCDLVISDILMPNLNGYALVPRIRAKWPSMPIILTSGYLSPDAAKAVLNGSVDFIPKPIDPIALIETVRRRMPKMAEPSAKKTEH
jgi:DNA-binding NtrC family response regulator